MGLAIVSFTARGHRLNRTLAQRLHKQDESCMSFGFYKYICEEVVPFEDLKGLIEELFYHQEAILFIGACGIAVRSIAPFLKGKDKDPAVLVMDECQAHIIALLSGHLGGANTWCQYLATLTGADPVITTATDQHHVFAVDLFAKANQLVIRDVKTIKEVSARLLHGEGIGYRSYLPWEGQLPSLFLQTTQLKEDVPVCGIVISEKKNIKPFEITCQLVPKDLVLGIGCRKGKDDRAIAAFIKEVFERHDLLEERILKLVSIDLKKGELGILQVAKNYGVPFETYDVPTLQQAKGAFTASPFVTQVVGVDNVCERAAVVGSQGGELLMKKIAKEGMTLAITQVKRKIVFE